MLKHIIKLIWTQRKSNLLIWFELLFVSIFLWYIVDYLYVTVRTYCAPIGFNIEHTYQVILEEYNNRSLKYLPSENKTTTSGEDILEVVKRIRNYPGVEAISLSNYATPYSYSMNSSNIRYDSITQLCMYRMVDPGFFKVFDSRTTDGKGPEALAKALEETSLVITRETEEQLLDGKSAIGKTFYLMGDGVPKKAGQVMTSVRRSEYERPQGCFYMLLTEKMLAESTKPVDAYDEISIRVSPEAGNDFPDRFRKEMADRIHVGNIYLLDIKPFEEQRQTYFTLRGSVNELKTRLAVMAFLLINIFLGIVGTFWMRTAARKSEMGLRVALGDTPAGLKRLLIAEGVVLLAFAAVPSLIICLNLGLLEVASVELMDFTVTRFLVTSLVTYVILVGMIVAGIWYPARNVAKIQPAEALHYE